MEGEKHERILDVVVLGGGFAGVYAAKELAREHRRNPEFRVGLIAAENYMVFQPMLPEVASASISPRHVINPIRQLCRGIEVFRGEVTGIDVEEKTVCVEAGDFTPDSILRFRQLVVCLGAIVDLSRVPGMPEHALLMQNVGDAMKLRATVVRRFEEANLVMDKEARRRLLTFVIVGGGYSGVETAGELEDMMSSMHRWYTNVDRDDYSVVLVHSQEHLLPTLSSGLGDYTQRKLEERGVRCLMRTRVKAVTATSVILNSGETIETSTVVSTVGNAPHPVVTDLATKLGIETVRGRIKTTPELRVPEVPWLWSAGDCAAVPLAGGKEDEVCPATAQFAQRQGTRLGQNLLALDKNASMKPFVFKGLGELAAIGHRTAVANVMGLHFSGFIAWWMWRTIYLAKLPGIDRRLRVMIDWTFDLFFPRDINLLSPRYTRLLKQVHLEAGDVLFNPGEPAFSLYFVKAGEIELHDGDRLIKTVSAGEYFGERALLEDKQWRFKAIARTSVDLVGLGAAEFGAIVEGSDALKSLFMRSAKAYANCDEVTSVGEQLGAETRNATADQLMTRVVDHLSPAMPLDAVLKIFRTRPHGSYPVVDADGKVLGVLKRDELYDFLKSGHSVAGAHVSDLPLVTLPSCVVDATGEQILEIMMRSGRNKILVLDQERHLCGLITLFDLVGHAASR